VRRQYNLKELHLGSALILDFIDESEKTRAFCSDYFSFDRAIQKASERRFPQQNRNVLNAVLKQQYTGIDEKAPVAKNIDLLLQPNVFTITVGHQLCLLGGPLFYFSKIAQAIALCRQLNEKQKELRFVPLFWMASEDHDFGEIDKLTIFNEQFLCEPPVTKGPAGRIPTTHFSGFLEKVRSKFTGTEQAKFDKIVDVYARSANLSEATRKFVHSIFGDFGLVVVDGDDSALKALFSDVMSKELLERTTERTVAATNQLLSAAGYHHQAFVREINLFGMTDELRERIVPAGDSFKIGDTTFNKEELIDEIHQNPSFLSPNALLRPLYQETILPNIVFMGGGGEIAYWLQLKKTFDAFGIPFPLIRLRDSYLITRKKDEAALDALGLDLPELLSDLDHLLRTWTLKNAVINLDLTDEKSALANIRLIMLDKASRVDATLRASVEAEFTKMDQGLEGLGQKLIRAEKRTRETELTRIKGLREKMLPTGDLQERVLSGIQFLVSQSNLIQDLVQMNLDNTQKIKLIVFDE